jgi:hypothetical protein
MASDYPFGILRLFFEILHYCIMKADLLLCNTIKRHYNSVPSDTLEENLYLLDGGYTYILKTQLKSTFWLISGQAN